MLSLLAALALLCLNAPAFAEDLDESLFDLGAPAQEAQASAPKKTPFAVAASFDEKKAEAVFTVTVQQGAYVYIDSLKTEFQNAQGGAPILPQGTPHRGPDGQARDIVTGDFKVSVTVQSAAAGAEAALTLQGCDQAGICYPPQRAALALPEIKGAAASNGVSSVALQKKSEESSFDGSLALTLALFVLLGMGLDLTPCVLPMLGVFTAMILGGGRRSLGGAAALSFSYLAGLVLSYTLLGWVIASAGMSARALLSSPYVSAAIALVFLIFALDCLGVITIKVPELMNGAIRRRLSSQRRGAITSAAIFGALSGLLTTPCTSAPLAGALLYVAKDGSVLRGTLMFMAIGLGMGLPLFVAGLFGPRVLPKPGKYSAYVRKFIALPLVFAAGLMLLPLFAYALWFEIGLAMLLTAIFVWVSMSALGAGGMISRAAVSCLYALCAGFVCLKTFTPATDSGFDTLSAYAELQSLGQSPVYVTFSASWCENCHALDRKVYSGKEFADFAADLGLKTVRFDLSDPQSPESAELIERFGVQGVPAAAVIKNGKISGLLSGYQSLEDIKGFIKAQLQ